MPSGVAWPLQIGASHVIGLPDNARPISASHNFVDDNAQNRHRGARPLPREQTIMLFPILSQGMLPPFPTRGRRSVPSKTCRIANIPTLDRHRENARRAQGGFRSRNTSGNVSTAARSATSSVHSHGIAEILTTTKLIAAAENGVVFPARVSAHAKRVVVGHGGQRVQQSIDGDNAKEAVRRWDCERGAFDPFFYRYRNPISLDRPKIFAARMRQRHRSINFIAHRSPNVISRSTSCHVFFCPRGPFFPQP
jgi:hypothetical protein